MALTTVDTGDQLCDAAEGAAFLMRLLMGSWEVPDAAKGLLDMVADGIEDSAWAHRVVLREAEEGQVVCADS